MYVQDQKTRCVPKVKRCLYYMCSCDIISREEKEVSLILGQIELPAIIERFVANLNQVIEGVLKSVHSIQ